MEKLTGSHISNALYTTLRRNEGAGLCFQWVSILFMTLRKSSGVKRVEGAPNLQKDAAKPLAGNERRG